MTVIAPLVESSATPFCDSRSLKDREIEALSTRKRYLRRSTRMFGHGTPLTRTTSPYIPDELELSKINGAEVGPPSANMASLRISGTSVPEPEPSFAALGVQ